MSIAAPEDPVVAWERRQELEESLFLEMPEELEIPKGVELLRDPTSFTMELIDHF